MPASSDIISKAESFCAYQERSQQEVRDKLYALGLHKTDVEQTISLLITGGFLNEERFAIAFAGGKFRIKQWGRIKIKLALKQKKVSPYCISKGLNSIPEKDYLVCLGKVIVAYSKKTTEKNPMKRKYKIAQYVIGRGYEPELVWGKLNDLKV
jgi:regulatory protein